MKRALITGVTGQDGYFLARYLDQLGYQVFGLVRHLDPSRDQQVRQRLPQVTLVEGDLADATAIARAIERSAPDEVYNLAAVTYVPASWQDPELAAQVNGLGVLRLLEAIRRVADASPSRPDAARAIRFFQAGSSEMFGPAERSPQDESTPFRPQNPYAAAKVYAHHVTAVYREAHGLFACNGILYNHESPQRPPHFVSRKIAQGVARIALGRQRELVLGNLDARRDWGYAGDFVRAMHLMLQHDVPGDYVVGTGEVHTVREFVEIAFQCVGLDWRAYVRVDPQLVRKVEPWNMCADATKARRVLGWQPTVSFRELVEMMVRADLERERAASDS
ncbi:MAG TPA: GDP-mannose 4,6-dehydratase [Chloroflexota bacterium]